MSYAKFAAVTANLLARKGEAAPWTPERRPPAWWADIEPAREPALPPPMLKPARALSPSPDRKMHKYALHMTEGDYEKLGLIAVKHGSTRQQLMQQALADFLAAQAREYRDQCACLGTCDKGCDGA